MSTEVTQLNSGIRIVTESMDSVRSVALGLWADIGSGVERPEESGYAHLLEHMLFRGTAKYESQEIDEIFDAMGAELNAGTDKESTSVFARVIDGHLTKALDIMGDMVLAPRLDPEDLEGERAIVSEEIAMYEDDPADKVFDMLSAATFGDHAFGRPTIGNAETVGCVDVDTLRAFHAEHYRSDRIVVSAAGAVEHEAMVELVRALPDRVVQRPPRLATAARPLPPSSMFVEKPTEQYNVCLGGAGLARDDERRFALRVLDTILGASPSSRLFQEVRERRALAYSVYSFVSLLPGTGQIGVYVGTRPENLEEALSVIGTELERFATHAVTTAELERAKENVKGRMLLALESTSARMHRLGACVLYDLPLLSIDEAIARVDAVRVDDVVALAALYAPDNLAITAIGPDASLFERALGSVRVPTSHEAAA